MNKIYDSLVTSGKRLRRARILAGFNTRAAMEREHGISVNTLQGWEQDKNPLSPKGAERMVELFKKEGYFVSVEWLLQGRGMPPRPFEMLNAGLKGTLNGDTIENREKNLQEEEVIYEEIQLFKSKNCNAIVISVMDDAMEPYFSVGNYVGGCRLDGDAIEPFLGTACIVELENNLILPRLLQSGTEKERYTLSCLNPKTKAAPLNLLNVRIINAAPILWVRRKISAFS